MNKEVYENNGISGWMSKSCLKWLVALGASGKLGAEAGCWMGRSTSAIASGLPKGGKLYAVDTWAGVPDDPKQHVQYFERNLDKVFPTFLENLKDEILVGAVTPLRMTSLEGAEFILEKHGLRSLDFVFIDADHRYEAVKADIEAYLPLVKSKGFIAGHDYKLEGVARAVRRSLPDYRRGPGSIWWWRVRP